MKKTYIFIIIFFGISSIFAQVEKYISELNSIDNLLTQNVKNILKQNLIDKKVVFLGEAEHHIGSDFLAKIEFVKYLVNELNYKDIVFESDFFGLYFEHNKRNVLYNWSNSIQCIELFEFLEKNNVTIWGFDNQIGSNYSVKNFTIKLTEFLDEKLIEYDNRLVKLVDVIIKKGFRYKKEINKNDIDYLINQINVILKNDQVKSDRLWYQIIESFKSAIMIYTSKSMKKGTPIRDKQMTKNLDFLIKKYSNKKFIVWLANAHMSKLNKQFMKGQTMGSQFIKLNPNISYHIAVSSIKMPYRKEKWLLKMSKDKNNLLHFLPTINKNYFLNSKKLIEEHPEYKQYEYDGMFRLYSKVNTNWFEHFDALIFISKGEKVKFIN